MNTAELIISSRWILPIAPTNTTLENHSIVINGGRIVALMDTQSALQQFRPKQHIELKQHVLLPGLINAHTHTPMNLFRGLADDLPLMDWLTQHIWPAEKALINVNSVQVGSRLAIAEMIRGGITCFNDNYFFPDTTAAVAIEEGIRAALGCVIMNIPTEWAQNEEEYFRKALAILDRKSQSHLITWTLCPHAPYTVSDKSLKMVKKLSEEYHLPIHMHVHETAFEIQQSLQEYGKRPLQRLEELGLLSEKFISIHMTQLIEDEIKRLALTGTHVVHCPESNLKLASGFTPIRQLLDAKVNVAIGTDGAASNNDLDLFSEIKTAALVAKAQSGDPTSLPAAQALELATINGAKALGLDDKIGSLEAGKMADVIAIDLGSYLTQPLYDPASHLVYAMNRLQVTDVWVNGHQLLKDKNFTRLDTAKLVQDAQQWAEKAKPFAADIKSYKNKARDAHYAK